MSPRVVGVSAVIYQRASADGRLDMETLVLRTKLFSVSLKYAPVTTSDLVIATRFLKLVDRF